VVVDGRPEIVDDIAAAAADVGAYIGTEIRALLANRDFTEALAGVGLAKTCRRYAIPVPPRGYWAKKQAGHKVRQLLLPANAPAGCGDKIEIVPQRRPAVPEPPPAPPNTPPLPLNHNRRTESRRQRPTSVSCTP